MGRLALGVGKGCQSQNMCKWYEFVPKELGPIKKGVSMCPRSRQVVNRSCIGKCSDHHQLIMGVGRMKNHGVRITYALQLLSVVLYTRWGAMEDLQFVLKHPVTMNLVLSGTILPPSCSVINSICSSRIPFANRAYALFVVCSRKPRFINFSALGPCQIHRAPDKYALHHDNLPKHKEERMKWQNCWA
jgi:hypothetical protein